jgi:hypothetical protein
MKNFRKLFVLLFVAGLSFYACDGKESSLVSDRLDDNPLPPAPNPATGTQGNADFTKYVSIGNSLTAGFMDAALYNDGQDNSLGAIIAAQMKIAVESDGDTFDSFDQPDINSVDGFNTSTQSPSGTPVLGRFKLDLEAQVPSPVITGEAIGAFSGNKAELNNFGIPGIQIGQMLTPATGGPSQGNPAFNPFYARIASNPSQDGATGSTIIGDVLASQPTFFTLWIGNNDVLGYALSGASNEAIFTSEADFQTRFNAVMTNLDDNTTARGVVATIPPVLTIPFFRAIPWNRIEVDGTTAGQINAGLQAVNGAIGACVNFGASQADIDRRLVSYSAGNNPILVVDEELDDLENCFNILQGAGQIDAQQRASLVPYEQSRPLVDGELVLLSAASVLNTPFGGDQTKPIGVVVPLGFNTDGSLSGDQFYLTLSEQASIQDRTTAFNTTIATEVLTANGGASAPNAQFALFDVNAGLPGNPNTSLGAFADLLGLDGEVGIRIQGRLLNPDFAPNGIYSTDGVHPNIRGNAILANEFLKVIETSFGASLPQVDVIALPSIFGCAGDCVSQQ